MKSPGLNSSIPDKELKKINDKSFLEIKYLEIGYDQDNYSDKPVKANLRKLYTYPATANQKMNLYP